MAKGTRKLNFRYSIIGQGVGGGALFVAGYNDVPVGDTGVKKTITSLNTAVAEAMAFNRRFQSAGIDTRIEVYGMVTGNDADTPSRALVAAEAAEQLYARIDTEELGLRTRIRLANHDNSAAGGDLGGDYAEDTEDKNAAEGG